MFLLYIISLAVISTICFILGFYILLKDKKSIINRLFFINSILLNIVIFFTILLQLPEQPHVIKFLQSIYNIILILFLIESLFFNLVFTKQKLNLTLKIILSVSTPVVFLIFLISSQSLLSVTRINGLWTYKFNNYEFWFFLYSPLLTFITVLMLYYLHKFSKSASLNKEKFQAKIIMISILIACGTGYIFLMVLPLHDFFHVPLLTPYFFSIYLFGVFYAMKKYSFLSFSIKDIFYEILYYVHDIVIILNPDKTITDRNNNLSERLLKEAGYFHGKSFSDIIEPDEEFSGKVDKLVSGELDSFESRIVFKNEPENIITDSNVTRISDRFGDFSAILIVSRENKTAGQFRKYFKLTAREMEIILAAITGSTNNEISAKFHITKRTVETHLDNIYSKIGINNKIELLKITSEFNV